MEAKEDRNMIYGVLEIFVALDVTRWKYATSIQREKQVFEVRDRKCFTAQSFFVW